MKWIKKLLNIFKEEKIFDNSLEKINKAKESFPRGVLLIYEDIPFYVVDYSGNMYFLTNKVYDNDVFIVTEFYNKETKQFEEKSFHIDFFRNRIKVFHQIENGVA